MNKLRILEEEKQKKINEKNEIINEIKALNHSIDDLKLKHELEISKAYSYLKQLKRRIKRDEFLTNKENQKIIQKMIEQTIILWENKNYKKNKELFEYKNIVIKENLINEKIIIKKKIENEENIKKNLAKIEEEKINIQKQQNYFSQELENIRERNELDIKNYRIQIKNNILSRYNQYLKESKI